MGIKILIILSIVFTSLSIVLATLNKAKFDKRNSVIKSLNNEHIKANQKIKKFEEEISSEEKTLNEKKTKLATINETYQLNQNKLDQLNTEQDKLNNRIFEIEQELSELEQIKTETGVDNLDELTATLEEKKKRIGKLKSEKENLEQDLLIKRETKQLLLADIKEINNKEYKRRRSYKNNSWEGLVTAVDDHWGFVVINAGKNRDINIGKEMIILRGNQYISTVKVNSVENNISIANIVRNNILKNKKKKKVAYRIEPGDRAIFKEPSKL